MAFLRTWSRLGAWASLFLAVLLVSCGGAGSAYGPSGSLEVANGGDLPMVQLFVTPSGSGYWGLDQLGGVALLPGDTLTLDPLDPGPYDVQAVFSDGSVDNAYAVQVLDAFPATVTMVNPSAARVSIVNSSNRELAAVYLVPVAAGTWGPNQAARPVEPGGTLTLTGIAPGSYDLRIQFPDGTTRDVRNISVAAHGTLTLPVQ